jgi:hypothetical protein
MGKGISDFEAYDYNPFRIDPFYVRRIGMVDKGKHDIHRAETHDGRTNVQYNSRASFMGYTDGQDYIRLFAASWDRIFGLSGTAQRVLGFVFSEVAKGVDEVQLNAAVMREILGFKTAASVYVGIVELLECKFLARKRGGDYFYINPMHFFGNNKRVGWHLKMMEFDDVHAGVPKILPEVLRTRVIKNKKRDRPGLAYLPKLPDVQQVDPEEVYAGELMYHGGEAVYAWKQGDGGWWCLSAHYYDMVCPDSTKRQFAVFVAGKKDDAG